MLQSWNKKIFKNKQKILKRNKFKSNDKSLRQILREKNRKASRKRNRKMYK